jgi:hypothetical protein
MTPKLYIATPSHDHKFHTNFVFSVFALIAARLFQITLSKVGGTGVARARNNMAQEFLASNADFCLCIDADIGFRPEGVQRVVAAAVANPDAIICAPYALKQEKTAWCVNCLPGKEADPETGLQEVRNAGTGFMLIPRRVFEAMIVAHPEIEYDEDLSNDRGKTRWDFFSMGVVDRNYLTEDWYFCHRARALGFRILADVGVELRHEGMISFPLPTSERIEELETKIAEMNQQLEAATREALAP